MFSSFENTFDKSHFNLISFTVKKNNQKNYVSLTLTKTFNIYTCHILYANINKLKYIFKYMRNYLYIKH